MHLMSIQFSLEFFQIVFLFFSRKMKMYEEQELTMQVFSEPEIATIDNDGIVSLINSLEFQHCAKTMMNIAKKC